MAEEKPDKESQTHEATAYRLAKAMEDNITREAILSSITTRSRRLIECELEFSLATEEQMKDRRLITQIVINLANKNIITIS